MLKYKTRFKLITDGNTTVLGEVLSKISTLCPVKNGLPRHRATKMSNLNRYE